MIEMIIFLAISFIFYTSVLIYQLYYKGRKVKKETKDNNYQPRNARFNTEFFTYANFSTILLVVLVVDNILQFVFVYVYLFSLVYTANKVHIKYLNKKINSEY